jgi:hypothetical protein
MPTLISIGVVDMGIGPGYHYRSCSSSPYAVPNSNPDPQNFRVIREQLVLSYLVLEVEYPDAKNFEGRKIMVYKGFANSKQVLKATGGTLDPHFAEDRVSPVARFAPTKSGWKTAVLFANALQS